MALRVFTSMYPDPLFWISKEHHSVLGNGRQHRCHSRAMPTARFGGCIQFLYESGLTRYCVQQAYITSFRNPMLQDSIRDAPYRLAKSFGALQILNSNPQFWKINKAEGQPPLELSGTC